MGRDLNEVLGELDGELIVDIVAGGAERSLVTSFMTWEQLAQIAQQRDTGTPGFEVGSISISESGLHFGWVQKDI